MAKGKKKSVREVSTEVYRHPEATSPLRPEVGTQAQFRKKKPPQEYRYDSSLSPELLWDGQNSTRVFGEWLLACIGEASRLPAPHKFQPPREFKNSSSQVVATVGGLADAVEQLKRIQEPFLNWAGKAERLSFDVPTLPLFVHERLSTKAIMETLKSHKRDKQIDMFDLYGDPQHSVTDQVLKAYEYQDKWVNRMVLGDSLVVMNSLLRYEGLGGQVQMIYFDPPYGVKFGSNFQPFVRKRDVSHNDDDDMTREPEMVKAYRDTWELGLHSYLTYMRDRLLLARELLSPSGSIFVQISDENVHHVREVMDEVFGASNQCATICYKKPGQRASDTLPVLTDFILWYAKDKTTVKYNQLYVEKTLVGDDHYTQVELPDGSVRPLSVQERVRTSLLPEGAKVFETTSLYSAGWTDSGSQPFEFKGKIYRCGHHQHWSTNPAGLQRLADVDRIVEAGNSVRFKRYFNDFPVMTLNNYWDDTGVFGESLYVVQTSTTAVQRCILMTTDPGDLVLDPTCGSGTTAYVAEEWGRRWITIDTSRVPLALARQRILTATFPYYDLKEENRGPVGGVV